MAFRLLLAVTNGLEMEGSMYAHVRSILVPTDFSAPSDYAIEYATGLAATLGASIHLLHVLDGLAYPHLSWTAPATEAAAIYERLYQDGRTKLAAWALAVEATGVAATTEVRGGTPSQEIVHAAVDYGADLIVMTTHGRSGLPHLVLGSVAEDVIRHARCPVLALRAAAVPEASETVTQTAVAAA